METPIALFAWSSLGVVVAMVLVSCLAWRKMHLMRLEIHRLAEAVNSLGSSFIRDELHELQQEVHQLCLDMLEVKSSIGLGGGANETG